MAPALEGAEGAPSVDPPAFQLTRREWADVLEAIGLWGFPRAFGTPNQVPVASPATFFYVLERALPIVDGHSEPHTPIFISHSRYAVDATWRHGYQGDIIFEWAFGDFDTGNGSGVTAAEASDELRRAVVWCVEHYLTFAVVGSGSEGGYHLRIKFREERQSRKYLQRWENAFWRGLKNELSMRSINIVCADPVHLERVPFTPHVKIDKKNNGFHVSGATCVPVPYAWVLGGEWSRIRDLEFHPKLYPIEEIVYRGSDAVPSIEAFVRSHGWETFAHEVNAFHPPLDYVPAGSAAELNRLFIPDRLCLQTLPFGVNPRHRVRLAWIHEIIATGLSTGKPFSLKELNDFCDHVAEEAKWEDRGNVNERRYQVEDAFRKPYALDKATGNVRPHAFSCGWLRENSICVGPSCPVFKNAFPAEWAEHLQAHPEAAK